MSREALHEDFECPECGNRIAGSEVDRRLQGSSGTVIVQHLPLCDNRDVHPLRYEMLRVPSRTDERVGRTEVRS